MDELCFHCSEPATTDDGCYLLCEACANKQGPTEDDTAEPSIGDDELPF